MSPTDNIVPFQVITGSKEAKAEPLPTFDDILESETEAENEMSSSVANLAMFLLDHKRTIKHFICGIAVAGESADDEEVFHVMTSPIDARDFALALKMLEASFHRNLAKYGAGL